MIAIIDYKAGNIQSVINALKAHNTEYCVAATPMQLEGARGIILPGVGSFGYAMDNLIASKMDKALIESSVNTPILGICLGQQLFYDYSEESIGVPGLKFIRGGVKKIRAENKKIPHMGWTSIEKTNVPSRLLEGIETSEFFYFVHSFCARAENTELVTGEATYGETFDAVVEYNNLYGVQFHPEKSGDAGLKLIGNFLKIVYGKAEENIR